MKAWIVKFVSLWVFNAAVLFVIGVILPSVRVGWSAIWAGLLLTAATLWLKPFVTKLFRDRAAKSARNRARIGEKLVQYGIVFVVEVIVWVLVVIFSGVDVRGFFWGWVLPPLLLLLAWVIYDQISDRVEAQASSVYDRASSGIRGGTRTADASPSPAAAEGKRELKDGLTPEQRRMLDELG